MADLEGGVRGVPNFAHYHQIRPSKAGVDPGFSESGGKGEWGVPPPTQSREAFAIIVCN